MNHYIKVSTYELNDLLFNEHTTCLFENDCLIYNNDNDNIKINLKNFSFTKENNETILYLSNNSCLLTLKEESQKLEIPLEYLNFEFDNNKLIKIEYKLISQDNPLKIIIEIGDEINAI